MMRALLRQTLNYVSHPGFVAWRARARDHSGLENTVEDSHDYALRCIPIECDEVSHECFAPICELLHTAKR
jgi:hypothetical protein